jgi:hypothetical protein
MIWRGCMAGLDWGDKESSFGKHYRRPGLEPGPITTNVYWAKAGAAPDAEQTLVVMGPAFAETTSEFIETN